jgi:7-cyano-7-deazaguanine reductase
VNGDAERGERPAGDAPRGERAGGRTRVAATAVPTEHLTVLGRTVREPLEHVECFPAPEGVTVVRFRTEELASMCPVTAQPDLSTLEVEYEPDGHCVESKSLKLYLWSFRDRPMFAEALAAEIARELMASARPHRVRVTVHQRPRGGIATDAVAELPPPTG